MSITGFEIFVRNEETLVTQEKQPIFGEYLADFIANMAPFQQSWDVEGRMSELGPR